MNDLLPRSQRAIERAISHPDIEYEMRRANGLAFVRNPHTGLVVPRRHIQGGAAAGYVEELYSAPLAGAAKNTFTTEFMINDTTTMGAAPVIPAFYFMPGKARGRSLRIVARGIASVTATPTWIWTFRLNAVAVPAVPPTGPNIGSNAAATALTGVTNQLWECELDVTFRLEAQAGAGSTLVGLGMVNAPGLFTPAAASALFGGGASPGTVATYDPSLLGTLSVGSTCSASSISNSIQLLQLFVFGQD